jgi:hypothetical protein
MVNVFSNQKWVYFGGPWNEKCWYTRVARWYILNPPHPTPKNGVNFGGPWNEKMLVYFKAIWNI